MAQADIALLLTGDALTVLGFYFQLVAVAALTYAFSHSVLLMSLQLAAGAVARLATAPLAGRLTDASHDRRRLMVAADLLRAVTALAFTRAAAPWEVVALAALAAPGQTFFFNARSALFVDIVGRDGISRLNGLRQITSGAARLAGPVAAGLVIARFGIAAGFYVNAAGYLLSIAATLAVRPRRRQPASRSGGTRAAYRVALGDPVLRELLTLRLWGKTGSWVVNTVFLVWVQALPFGGPALLGLSLALYEGGSMVAGGVLLSTRRVTAVPWLRLAAALEALAWCAYLLARTAVVVLAVSTVEGILDWALMVFIVTAIQLRAPAEVLGGVLAAEDQADNGGRLAGTALAGPLTALVAIPGAFAAAAALAALGYGATRLFTRQPPARLRARAVEGDEAQ